MKVVLVEACASDLAVVNAARVSFKQESTDVGDREKGLINFLMKNRHGTPFEHGYLRFHVEVPLFVAREWFRHRIGSFNEWSGRYSVIEPNFFMPAEFRTQVGKPGAYTFESIIDPVVDMEARGILGLLYEHAQEAYQELLDLGVAKEQARMGLPVATYTSFHWSVNPRALMNFLSLRTAPEAMKEIRDCALAVEELWRVEMPVTHETWVANDRLAP